MAHETYANASTRLMTSRFSVWERDLLSSSVRWAAVSAGVGGPTSDSRHQRQGFRDESAISTRDVEPGQTSKSPRSKDNAGPEPTSFVVSLETGGRPIAER